MTVLSLTLGLIGECISYSNILIFNPKLVKSVKDIIKTIQGKGREENKKIEGTGFGYPRNGLIDYSVMYLDRVYVYIVL